MNTTHTFPFRGHNRTIAKHPTVIGRASRGELTDDQVAQQTWYLRITHQGREISRSLGTSAVGEAVRRARERLAAQADRDDFGDILEASRRRAALTLSQLAQEWIGLRCPQPGGITRTPDQVARIEPFVRTALIWWGGRAPASIRPRDLQDYAAARRAAAPAGCTGERACDLELSALSSLCQWGVSAERIASNPFAGRPRFRQAGQVQHCHTSMPSTDDELHRICGWMMSSDQPSRVVAGAHLMCCALTGLRPGEPGALLAHPPVAQDRPVPGTRYTVSLDGVPVEKLAVARLKAGQNRAIIIHRALSDFLLSWRQWLAVHYPTATHLFPDPTDTTKPLVDFGDSRESRLHNDLSAACKSLQIQGERHPHGMRAFYVRVRRAQGQDDSTIAVELGQGSGPGLIRRTYGDPEDVVGDGRYDWLPAPPAVPCWTLLAGAAPANLIAL